MATEKAKEDEDLCRYTSTIASGSSHCSSLGRSRSRLGTLFDFNLHGLFSRPSTMNSSTMTRIIDTRVLSDAIPPHILRGVPLERALAGCGKHWRGDISGGLSQEEAAQGQYELSMEVEAISDFISHDWASGRWAKYLTLVCIYNFKAAFLWSTLVAFLVTLIEGGLLASGQPLVHSTTISVSSTTYLVHTGIAALIIPPPVFVLILLFGQHLPGLCTGYGRVMTFVDKLCIHQTDLEKKTQGICCISGFLKRSDRIVVLWSPQYLTRLWCVYEVACWIHLKKNFRTQALFAPMALYVGGLAAWVGTYMFYCVFLICMDQMELWDFVKLVPLVIVVCLPLPLRLARRTVYDLGCMRKQLKRFRVQSAECFCCSIKHTLPDSLEPVPCDRDLIYRTLSSWFKKDDEDEVKEEDLSPREGPGSTTVATETEEPADEPALETADETGEYCLNRFNDFVHQEVMSAISESTLNAKMRYVLCLNVSTPLIWYTFSRWLVFLQIGQVDSLRYLLESVTYALLLYPAVVMVCLRLASLSNRLGRSRAVAGGLSDVLLTLLALGCAIAVAFLIWAPLVYSRTLSNFLIQALVTSAEILLCLLIFVAPWKP